MTWDMRLDPFGNLLPGASYDDPPGMDPAEQEFLLSMFDTPITIQRSFVEVCGDLGAAALLSDLSTLGHESSREWIEVPQQDWIQRLGLSRKQQATARRHLVARGLLDEQLTGVPPRLHFRIVWPALEAALREQAVRRTARCRCQ